MRSERSARPLVTTLSPGAPSPDPRTCVSTWTLLCVRPLSAVVKPPGAPGPFPTPGTSPSFLHSPGSFSVPSSPLSILCVLVQLRLFSIRNTSVFSSPSPAQLRRVTSGSRVRPNPVILNPSWKGTPPPRLSVVTKHLICPPPTTLSIVSEGSLLPFPWGTPFPSKNFQPLYITNR